jgi:hypothetical protein
MKDLEQYSAHSGIHNQAPGMEDTAIPEITIHNHEAKRHFPTKLLALGAAGLIAAGALAANEIANFTSQLWGDIQGAVPHRVLEAQVSSALEQVSLPDETILVDGKGTGSATLDLEFKSSGLGFISDVWNATGAKLTKMSSSTEIKDDVQVGMSAGAVTLSPYRPSTANSGSGQNWGIKATVDESKLFSQPVGNVHTIYNQASDGFLVNLVSLVGVSSNMAERVTNTTTYSQEAFQNACGSALIPDISGGVQTAVQADVLQSAHLLQAIPDQKPAAQLLKHLAQEPVQVVFQGSSTSANGKVTTYNINPADVTLPAQTIPTNGNIATDFGMSAHSVQLDTSGNTCYFTGNAIQDQVKILEQSADASNSSGSGEPSKG